MSASSKYKKRAKELVSAAKSPDLDKPHIRRAVDKAVAELLDEIRKEPARIDGRLTLAGSQFLVARLHGYENWKAFSAEVKSRERSTWSPFEMSVELVVAGNAGALRSELADHPGLIRERSHRAHRAALLHYIAAHGVEDYRQQTPENAVEIARILLEAGADVGVVDYVTGIPEIDAVLDRHRARPV